MCTHVRLDHTQSMDLINSGFNREKEVTCDHVDSPIRGTQGECLCYIRGKYLTRFNKIKVLNDYLK